MVSMLSWNPAERSGYTGRISEAELWGEILPEYFHDPELLRRAKQEHKHVSELYLHHREAREFVKRYQPQSYPIFAQNLLDVITKELQQRDPQIKIRIFTAVRNTTLDVRHHVDAFLEFEKPGLWEPIIVTFDSTMDPDKTTTQADVLVQVPPHGLDPTIDRAEFDEVLNNTARRAIDRFQRQMV